MRDERSSARSRERTAESCLCWFSANKSYLTQYKIESIQLYTLYKFKVLYKNKIIRTI